MNRAIAALQFIADPKEKLSGNKNIAAKNGLNVEVKEISKKPLYKLDDTSQKFCLRVREVLMKIVLKVI